MGIFGTINQAPKDFEQKNLRFHNEKLRAERRGDTLGANIAGQGLKNLQSQQQFRMFQLRRFLGGRLTASEQTTFDAFRRAKLKKLRNNPLRAQ